METACSLKLVEKFYHVHAIMLQRFTYTNGKVKDNL